MRIKICGITKPDQGKAIAQLGATALGFICVPQSPRYVLPEQIRLIVEQLPSGTQGESVQRIGVFANASLEAICQTVTTVGLNGAQLHGSEPPEFCHQLRQALPDLEIIKALRVKTPEALQQVDGYRSWVDTLLLDAYDANQLGGTGKTLEWRSLHQFNPGCPWLLAGGLTPDNITTALNQLHPDGIDLSSGVERSPGDKDLDKVARFFERLKRVEVAREK